MTKTAMDLSKEKQKTSAGKLWGRSVIYGKEDEHMTPMMTRYWFGRLRIHIFYRGDLDPDCHDHPWDFWTFPLVPYAEEVLVEHRQAYLVKDSPPPPKYFTIKQVVPAWRWTFREATHKHRVLGKFAGWATDLFPTESYGKLTQVPCVGPGRIITIVWRSPAKRKWGFTKNRDGRWCWVPWTDYVYGDGKSAPCE